MAGEAAKAGAIDQRLRMLDPRADRKRLGLDLHTAPVQHRERVPGTVADRKDHMGRLDLLPRPPGSGHAHRGAVSADIDHESSTRQPKPVFAAQRLDFATECLRPP